MRSSHGRRRWPRHAVLLSVLLAGLPVALARTGAAPECAACHTTPHATATNAGAHPGCAAACHDSAVKPTVGETEEGFGDDESPSTSADGLLPGMRVPLYYDQTRVGTQPNEMVLVPAGAFTMGTDERLPDEGPAHSVTLPAYSIDRYEVTNGQYKAFIDATGHRSPAQFENRSYLPGKVDHPVTGVSWNDAHDYCEWAGKRLPTDEEWEKAARGTDGRRFPWGNEFGHWHANNPQYWANLHRDGDTSPVGALPAGTSPYGLYDMSGNVWEWTDSWYRAYPGNEHPNENYGEHYKTLKGGSWWDCSFYKCGISAPSFNRAFFLKTTKNNSFGFRCAKDAP